MKNKRIKIEDFPLVIYEDGQAFLHNGLKEHDGYFMYEGKNWTVLSANPVNQNDENVSQGLLGKLSALGGLLSAGCLGDNFLFVEKKAQGVNLFEDGCHLVVKNNKENKEIEFMYDRDARALNVCIVQSGQEFKKASYTKDKFRENGLMEIEEMVWAVVDNGPLPLSLSIDVAQESNIVTYEQVLLNQKQR